MGRRGAFAVMHYIYPGSRGLTTIAIGPVVASADRCPDIRAGSGFCQTLARPGAITGGFGAELIRRTFTVVLAGWSGRGRAFPVVDYTYSVVGGFTLIAIGDAIASANRGIDLGTGLRPCFASPVSLTGAFQFGTIVVNSAVGTCQAPVPVFQFINPSDQSV